ncbi:MAG TPA: HEPN domain-containing protein [Alphaproteobacteria bacterium]
MSGREAGSDAVQWEEARRWFAQADDDIRVAWACLAAAPPIVGAAALHCQQAAEKTLKGLLIAARQKTGKTHNLGELTTAVAAQYAPFRDDLDWLRELTEWYLGMRYPDIEIERPPAAAAVSTALESVSRLLERARSLDPTRTATPK